MSRDHHLLIELLRLVDEGTESALMEGRNWNVNAHHSINEVWFKASPCTNGVEHLIEKCFVIDRWCREPLSLDVEITIVFVRNGSLLDRLIEVEVVLFGGAKQLVHIGLLPRVLGIRAL